MEELSLQLPAAEALLRPALETALAVARSSQREESPPAALRPFLRFTYHRAPSRALGPARQALDNDEAFRARVAQATSEEAVGRAGWLFLTRPEGWEADLAALVEEAEVQAGAAREEREERTARRRLSKLEDTVRRADAEAASAREEARQASERLVYERRARREAEEMAARLKAHLVAVEADRDQEHAAAQRSAAQTAALEAEVTRLSADLAAAHTEKEQAQTEARSAAALVDADRLRRVQAILTAAVADAVGPISHLSEALADAASLLAAEQRPLGLSAIESGPGEEADDGSRPAAVVTAPVESAAEAGRAHAAPTSFDGSGSGPSRSTPMATASSTGSRAPAPLPPGVFEDSDMAADHLVRLDGVVLVVDGYNISYALWPDQSLSEQRRRLVGALTELAARTGAEVEVIFDGAEGEGPGPVPIAGRQPVRVRFSPPHIEADDVVIARTAEVPVNRPVVVASSDHRVRDGARKHGANVISSSQLAMLLRARH